MLRLDLVIGPNGSGKSTFVRLTLSHALPRVVSVDADEIARQRWPDAAEAHAYDAARLAALTRAALIAARRPFIAETVFSHPSKLDLIDRAHESGYTVFLHVLLVPEALAVARVDYRVRAGGHSVPEDKIRQRYRRLWPLVATAIATADVTTVYDASQLQGPRVAAQLAGGAPIGAITWPPWTPDELTTGWPAT